MALGTVKSYSSARGIGILTPDGGGPDLLFQQLITQGAGRLDVAPNQRVSFELAEGASRVIKVTKV